MKKINYLILIRAITSCKNNSEPNLIIEPDMNDKLKIAINLRNQEKFTESEILMKELIVEEPKNATFYYQYAWLCDNMEKEKDAYPKYEKAIELGQQGEDLQGCYLGLGSTYRCIGEYDKSIKIFDKAISEFPKNNEFKVFKSMALHNLKKHDEAINILLNVIAKTSSDKGIIDYKKAIEYYSDKLNKKFE
jgi:tetratricopeptide (TPR) repeat protein